MINSSNLCIFEGRVAREPQCNNIQIGQDTVEKAIFTIAVDRALSTAQRQKVKQGDNTIKTADFIPCSLLGAKVAVLKQYFPVGKSIKVIGHYTEYQTTDQQTGQKKYGHIFEVDEIGFTTQDSKNLQQNNTQVQNTYQQPQQNNMQMQPAYQQTQQQPVQNGFAMFDEGAAPF